MKSKIYFAACISALFFSCQKDSIIEEQILDVLIEEDIVNPIEKESKFSADPVKNWVYQMQHTTGLLESVENTNFVSLYDNALATILFINDNQKNKAEQVLDFYNSKISDELEVNGGFYQTRNTNGEAGERIWMGDNAWLLIAINHYKEQYNSDKYANLAAHLEAWLRSLQIENGALLGGINSNGSNIPLVTEGIITAFNAVPGFDDFHKNILSYIKNERWDSNNNVILSWPENPDYAYAMDLHSLSSTILDGFSENVLEQANRYLTDQEFTLTGEVISGYCFDEDNDVVWLEGTAQMAVAFKAMGNIGRGNELIAEIEKTIIQSTIIENAKGIPYTTNHGTSYGATVLWDHADIAPSLSASIWYLFAKEDFSPLALGLKQNIPTEHQFWTEH
jgi:hypothetical protein